MGAWGDAVRAQAKKEVSIMKKSTMPERKLRLMQALRQVAKKLHKKDLQWWVKNCGRYVSKHMGPVIWLVQNGVVQKKRQRVPLKKAAKRKKPVQSRDWEKLDFGKAGGRGAYLLVGMDDQRMNMKLGKLLEEADGAQKTRHA